MLCLLIVLMSVKCCYFFLVLINTDDCCCGVAQSLFVFLGSVGIVSADCVDKCKVLLLFSCVGKY